MGVKILAQRLDKRLSLLTKGARTSPPRHQTLRALLDWSYDLLTDNERVLLPRVGIFSGGWTLDAVEAISRDMSLDAEIMDSLSSLVDKSLVVVEQSSGSVRYRLLDSTREYALEKLEASGEQDIIARRHARWIAAFAEQAELAGWNEPIRRWLPLILAELGNARVALRWALSRSEEFETAGRIAAGFGKWGAHFGAGEARSWVESALTHANGFLSQTLTAQLWLSLAFLSAGPRRVELPQQAIAVFERFGDIRRLAAGYTVLGNGYYQLAQFEQANAALERARSLLQQTGHRRSSFYAMALQLQGAALGAVGRLDEGRELYREAAGIFEALDDPERAANEMVNLAELEFAAGDAARALAIVNGSIDVLRNSTGTGFRLVDSFEVPALLNAAAYSLVLRKIEPAREAAREALAKTSYIGFPQFTAVAIQHLATVAAMRDQATVAARLGGFVDDVFRLNGFRRELTEQRTYDVLRQALHARFSKSELERLTADGVSLTEDQVIEMALAID